MKVPVPKKTRNLEKSRKEILDAAFIQIFTKGFQGTSIDDIVGKTQFTKGTFYHQFPTKLDLGYALVDEVIAPMIIDRWIVPLEKFENPLEGILFQLKTLIGESDPKHLKLGCPLNNLVQEMSPIDKEFHKKLKQALNLWIDELEKHLLRGQKSGFIQKSINTRQIAQFIVMAHEGFYGLIKGLDDPDIFKSLYIQLQSFFKPIEV